jgi:hypothetical protein
VTCAEAITAELRAVGFKGNAQTVRRYLQPFRLPETSRSHPGPRRRKPAPASLKLVLEPVFEADFLPCSYGFRPGRHLPLRGTFGTIVLPYSMLQLVLTPSARGQALAEAARVLGKGALLHIDVSGSFDTRSRSAGTSRSALRA